MFKDVIKYYQSTFHGKKVCYIPSELSDKLLVLMAPHNQGDKFTWIKQLIPNQMVNLLYINNPEDDYYDTKNDHASYIEIIKEYSDSFSKKNVTLLGSSMSATAAIRIGIIMGLPVMAVGPQVCFDETVEFAIKSFPKKPKHKLIEDISRVESNGAWVDLDKYVSNYQGTIPPIYLLYNHVRFDTRNAYPFIQAMMKRAPAKFIHHHSSLVQHGFNINNPSDVDAVYRIMDLLSGMYELKFSWEPS